MRHKISALRETEDEVSFVDNENDLVSVVVAPPKKVRSNSKLVWDETGFALVQAADSVARVSFDMNKNTSRDISIQSDGSDTSEHYSDHTSTDSNDDISQNDIVELEGGPLSSPNVSTDNMFDALSSEGSEKKNDAPAIIDDAFDVISLEESRFDLVVDTDGKATSLNPQEDRNGKPQSRKD